MDLGLNCETLKFAVIGRYIYLIYCNSTDKYKHNRSLHYIVWHKFIPALASVVLSFERNVVAG